MQSEFFVVHHKVPKGIDAIPTRYGIVLWKLCEHFIVIKNKHRLKEYIAF